MGQRSSAPARGEEVDRDLEAGLPPPRCRSNSPTTTTLAGRGKDDYGQSSSALDKHVRANRRKRKGWIPKMPWRKKELSVSAHSGGDVPGRGYIGSHSERAASSPAETTDVLQMARYLGMDPSEHRGLLWIAEEALTAALPEQWEEHRAKDGTVYYFNPITKESAWEHPADGYYRFLFQKLRRIRHGKKERNEDASRSKDRELVDLLWAMEQEKRRQERSVNGRSHGSDSSFSVSVASTNTAWSRQSQMTWTTMSPTSRASSRSLSSFCSTPGDFEVDPESIPDEVREIATYLGINLSQLQQPVTPDEVKEMAGHLGVDCVAEPHLLYLPKMALAAPLPKNWEIYKDRQGNPFYFNRISKRTSYRHPADDYFLRRVKEERERVKSGEVAPVSGEWIDFITEEGQKYLFNFRTNERKDAPSDPAWSL